MRKVKFTFEKRQKLENVLKNRDKIKIIDLSKSFGVSKETMYKEMKRGLNEYDIEHRNYQNYSWKLAQLNAEKTAVSNALSRVR